jgi:hypothetical protein
MAALDGDMSEKLSSGEKKEREDILTRSLQELRRFRKPGGGYGSGGSSPGLLETASALMAQNRAGIRDCLYIEDRKWLLSRRQGDGFWPGEGGASSLPLSSFILWVLRDDKVGLSEQGAAKIAKEAMTSNDSLSLALAICALKGNHCQKSLYDELLTELIARSGPAGDEWALRSVPSRACGYGSLGGSLLASAFAVLALDAQQPEEGQKKRMARFFLNHALRDGTWGPSLETPLVVEALMRLYGTQPWKGVLRLETGGRVSHVIRMGGERTRMYRSIDLSDSLTGDSVELLMHGQGEGALFYQLSSTYFKGEPGDEISSLERRFEPARVKCGEDSRCSISWKFENSSGPIAILEIPLPWGSSVDPAVLDGYVKSGRILGYREDKGRLSFYVKTEGKAGTFSFPVKLNVPCRVELRPAELRDLYNDRRWEKSSFTRLEVEE